MDIETKNKFYDNYWEKKNIIHLFSVWWYVNQQPSLAS